MTETTTPPETEQPPGAPHGRLRRSARWSRAHVMPALGSLQAYIGLILIVLIGIITKGQTFWNQTTLTDAVTQFSSRGILAVGVTLVILVGGIDLSVGSILGIGSMTAAMLLVHHGLSPLEIVPLCGLVGAAFGFANGLGTTYLKIQSFVMTLAMLNIVRGLDRQISHDEPIGVSQINNQGNLTHKASAFAKMGTPGHNLFTGVSLPIFGKSGIPYPVIAFVVICVVFQLILSKTQFGQHIYAVGGNPTAARLSGVNVTFIIIAVFTLSGMLAGLAGPIDAAYSAQADPLAGTSYELDAIAAAVIGGASLAGGKGKVTGTLIGALILTLLDEVLGLNNVSADMQLIIKGLIVVVAVVVQRPDLFRSLASGVRRLIRRFRPIPKQSGE
jgi:ribose transport system permease protein